jgi:hypothetical protein
MTIMNDLLAKLSEPFKPEHITWKPGSTTKDGTKCMAMAYADFRAYMERLDEVCGLDWSVEYKPWGTGRIIAYLTTGGVTRCSTGEMGAQDEKNGMGGTVAEAQAMKRAAAMFGLGRYLYDLPDAWVEFDSASKRISKAGLAELDRRYKTWYTEEMKHKAGGHKQNRPQATQAAVENSSSGESGYESPPHQRMFGQGASAFGPDWDMARPWLISKWTAKVTPDNTRNSATELSDTEKDLLADYIKDNLIALQKVWPKQKAIMQQLEVDAH